jgi:hypothetical protein
MKFRPDSMLLLKTLEPYGSFDEIKLALRLGSIDWSGGGRKWFAFPNWDRVNFWATADDGTRIPIATAFGDDIRVRLDNDGGMITFPILNALAKARELQESDL